MVTILNAICAIRTDMRVTLTLEDEETEHLELRQKDNCYETLPTIVDRQFHPQIENPTLDEPAFLLGNSSDNNSIPDSQHSLSLSLLDDEESGFELQKSKARPNVIIQETDCDSDTSVSTCLTNSSLDFSSDDSVADPDFIIKNDLEMTDIDSDEDNYAYYLPLNNERTRVCKVFFMNTLAISDKSIRTVLKKRKSTLKDIQLQDLRGKHNNHHKIDASLKAGVKAHINSIPRIESHYCRAQTKREYIEGGLTVAAMHRNYVEKCSLENKPHVTYQIYYNIFRNEFNISFWKPKKDQCEECTAFNNSEDKALLQQKHEEHLKEKSLSRAQKEKDKENVSENFIVAVYDLQAVLPCPRGDVSSFYYIPKINLLNFTITQLGSKATTCFVWHEGEGARGVNEIGSCVLFYLEELNTKATEQFDVVFYSDNCCGQQKNKFMVAMYQYAISKFSKLNSITHKFLIKGHTQNEGDAVHSTIQRNISRALKSSPIYVPDQYITLIKTAKKKGAPYLVKELTHESFFNLKTLASSSNYTINEDDFVPRRGVQSCGYTEKKQQNSSNFINIPKKLYTQKINISQAKKQGILNLIKKNIIPKYYEGFFSSL
ncbi:unnamed protein product [Euphydryas editha]|uniref:DUF7869 domain-containing protein n=1 Tax=Euphydryas editha TaxID=104508 RepID=A0AAU9U907_EUPED|nr:unnamed protein product [Euphydryas editha]